jgi:hypothetical protein
MARGVVVRHPVILQNRRFIPGMSKSSSATVNVPGPAGGNKYGASEDLARTPRMRSVNLGRKKKHGRQYEYGDKNIRKWEDPYNYHPITLSEIKRYHKSLGPFTLTCLGSSHGMEEYEIRFSKSQYIGILIHPKSMTDYHIRHYLYTNATKKILC